MKAPNRTSWGAEQDQIRKAHTMSYVKKSVTALFVGAVLTAGAAAPATAANNKTDQDGLVNVNVGDVNLLNNVDIGVAAQVAATICGVKVGPVAVLGTAVDGSGATRTVCTTDQGPVTISN